MGVDVTRLKPLCPWKLGYEEVLVLRRRLQAVKNKICKIGGTQHLTQSDRYELKYCQEIVLEYDRYWAIDADKRPKRYRAPTWLRQVWSFHRSHAKAASAVKVSRIPLMSVNDEAVLAKAGRLGSQVPKSKSGITYAYPPGAEEYESIVKPTTDLD